MVIDTNEVEANEKWKINYNIDVDFAYLWDFVTKFGYAVTQVLLAWSKSNIFLRV